MGGLWRPLTTDAIVDDAGLLNNILRRQRMLVKKYPFDSWQHLLAARVGVMGYGMTLKCRCAGNVYGRWPLAAGRYTFLYKFLSY